MSDTILKNLKPEKELKNINFLKETCAQINKDLMGFTALKIELTEALLENPLNEILSQLNPIVDSLEASSNLQPFVYKVDLPEAKYVAYCVKEKTKAQFSQDIVERSAQKVYLRWHFSNRLNS